jgi:hypothetical protein
VVENVLLYPFNLVESDYQRDCLEMVVVFTIALWRSGIQSGDYALL